MVREQMNIVVVGHVDHGKSTLVGRLLAQTNSLPEGKLDQIRSLCDRESKEFEYAFLLDALKDEQSQGITIDSSRVFFRSKNRDYLIIDAPGHIEFLKNMVSGAARAEAAVLVIDVSEGIRENTKRHAYLLKMLGIGKVFVVVNKMDRVSYSKDHFDMVVSDANVFFKEIGLSVNLFIPVSAREGENLVSSSNKMGWYTGGCVLESLDGLEKEKISSQMDARLAVQDVYKFTSGDDNRRLISGRVNSGSFSVGNEIMFLPSTNTSTIASIEEFNVEGQKVAFAGRSTAFTLTDQLYVRRGEIMCKPGELLPAVSSRIKANIFWLGKSSFVRGKEYILKVGTQRVPVFLREVVEVLDASSLEKGVASSVKQNEVSVCILETSRPIAFDLVSFGGDLSHFVIVDKFDICGGGIITSDASGDLGSIRNQVLIRESKWVKGDVSVGERAQRFSQKPVCLLITGPGSVDKVSVAKCLERDLFDRGRNVYFLGIGNMLRGVSVDVARSKRDEHIRRLGEVCHILLNAGQIVIATASDLDNSDISTFKAVVGFDEVFVFGMSQRIGDVTLVEGSATEQIVSFLKNKNIIFDHEK